MVKRAWENILTGGRRRRHQTYLKEHIFLRAELPSHSPPPPASPPSTRLCRERLGARYTGVAGSVLAPSPFPSPPRPPPLQCHLGVLLNRTAVQVALFTPSLSVPTAPKPLYRAPVASST